MTLRKDPQRGQFDLFAPYISDMPLRDQRETMERPFFSLAKRKRLAPIDYVSPDGLTWVKVHCVPQFGMATIWDADILIWAASVVTEMKENGKNDIPRKITFHAHDLLKTIRRPTGGADYEKLRAALARLQSTTITTNIRADKVRGKKRQFSWIESWDEDTGKTDEEHKGMTITLSDWLYEGILMDGGILAIDPDYFRLKGGRERWLYRVARKHAGGNSAGFTISMPTLFEKSGAEGTYRRFKFEIKKIATADSLPEFHLTYIEDTEGGEPSLHMVRRSFLATDHPGYQYPKRRDRRSPAKRS